MTPLGCFWNASCIAYKGAFPISCSKLERPAHTCVDVPGVDQVVAETVFPVDVDISHVGNSSLVAQADIKPIALVVNRKVSPVFGGGGIKSLDVLLTMPFA